MSCALPAIFLILADLVVISDDILTCPLDRIRDIKAEMTIVGGKIVYRSKSSE